MHWRRPEERTCCLESMSSWTTASYYLPETGTIKTSFRSTSFSPRVKRFKSGDSRSKCHLSCQTIPSARGLRYLQFQIRWMVRLLALLSFNKHPLLVVLYCFGQLQKNVLKFQKRRNIPQIHLQEQEYPLADYGMSWRHESQSTSRIFSTGSIYSVWGRLFSCTVPPLPKSLPSLASWARKPWIWLEYPKLSFRHQRLVFFLPYLRDNRWFQLDPRDLSLSLMRFCSGYAKYAFTVLVKDIEASRKPISSKILNWFLWYSFANDMTLTFYQPGFGFPFGSLSLSRFWCASKGACLWNGVPGSLKTSSLSSPQFSWCTRAWIIWLKFMSIIHSVLKILTRGPSHLPSIRLTIRSCKHCPCADILISRKANPVKTLVLILNNFCISKYTGTKKPRKHQ